MKYWFDTEFIEDGRTIDLISIGIVAEDGRKFYCEFDFDHRRASPWVKENVIPHLKGDTTYRKAIAAKLITEFCGEKPEFWAYYGAYDWVALCQLFGTMMDLPKSWPMYVRDVKQLCDQLGNPKLPEQGKGEHHALADAEWTKAAWQYLSEGQLR
jgi:3' exoribonuclease, RNase T-like